MDTCQRCSAAITQPKRGRRRLFCADCAKLNTAESKRRYQREQRERAISRIPVQCCRDWASASPRNGFVCRQHRQWIAFVKYRSKVEWSRGDLEKFAWVLSELFGDDTNERKFSIVTPDLFSPSSRPYIMRG